MTLSPSSTYYIIFGLLISGISSCLTSLNFWITILNLRLYYLTLKTIPLFPWAFLITAFMLLLTLPILSGTLLLILGDLHSNTLFFDPIFGGDPIFYQHLFWFFGHPEVYVLIIPTFGIINMTLPFLNTRRVASKHHLIWAIYVMAYMGFVVWGHHMYLVGLDHRSRSLYSTITIMISLPATIKVVNWTLTLINGALKVDVVLA